MTKKSEWKKFIVSLIVIALVLAFVLVFYSGIDIIPDNSQPTMTEENIRLELSNEGVLSVSETHNLKFSNRGREWYNYYKVIDTSGYDTYLPTSSLSMRVDGEDYPVVEGLRLDYMNESEYSKYYGNSYITKLSSSKYEIGVIMPKFTKGERSIEFNYTLAPIVTSYSDVAGLYYKFIEDNNAVKIKKLNAEVVFPSSSKENTFFWLHIATGNGTIERVDNKLVIKAKNIPKETFVELRLTMDKSMFSDDAIAKVSSMSLEDIKSEELSWYNEHKSKMDKARVMLIIDITLAVIIILVCLIYAIGSYLYRKPHKIDNIPLYLHEPPTTLKVEEGMPIFYHYREEDWLGNTMSATIMSLFKKKRLTILDDEDNKGKMYICNDKKEGLNEYEGIVLDYLNSASNGMPFTMDILKLYSKINYEEAHKKIKNYKKSILSSIKSIYKEQKNGGAYLKFMNIAIFGAAALILSLQGTFKTFGFDVFFVGISLIVSSIIIFLTEKLIKKPLPKVAEIKYQEMKAFEKFMLDFSSFDKKDIPELIFWEDYLIWATAMGIADKVSEKLATVYPEYMQYYSGSVMTNTFVYWYLFSPSFRVENDIDFTSDVNSINNSIDALRSAESIKNSTNSFGGFGGGGSGFSGGGGGFGGGGGMGAR